VDREFNLSNAASRRRTTDRGRPLDAREAGAVSVEEGIAKTLGLKLGDQLRFDIGGVPSEAHHQPAQGGLGSMRANFFVMYPLAQMQDVPMTCAYRAPEVWPPRSSAAQAALPALPAGRPGVGSAGFDNALVRAFPNITNVDMSATLAQVQGVLDQVIRAVEFLFAFTLAAGLVVLFAAVTATREERAREFAIMRAVGARQPAAPGAARRAGWAWACWPACWPAAWPWPWAGAGAPCVRLQLDGAPLGAAGRRLAGALLALAAGWWGLREVLQRPVVQTLRRAQD
jgi:putative ABC transport system permease protein